MLTSRLPFDGDNPVSIAIQHFSAVPLSPREINPDIPEALEQICMKAMAADRNRRYATADEMLADLESFRKDPTLSFEYSVEDLQKDGREDDEPTQYIPNVAATRGKQPHIPAPPPPPAEEEEEERPRSNWWKILILIVVIAAAVKNYAIGSEEVIKDQSEAEALYREKTLDGFRTLIKLVGNLYEKDRNEAIERQIKILELENEKLKIEHQLMKAQKEESKKE